MEHLIIILLQRIGVLLVIAFMLTRIPAFRHLLDRKLNVRTVIYYAVIFGAFGILATQAGVMLQGDRVVPHGLVLRLAPGETIVGPTLVVTVIAGLLGGPFVGIASGIVSGAYFFGLAGADQFADTLVNPLVGLLSGLTARFFSKERVIAPQKAMFIGMFAPILHMGLLLIFSTAPTRTIALVNTIGLPLVVTNSLAIAVFTLMIHVVLAEQEQGAAREMQRALRITERALPHLRRGLNYETATAVAELLYEELKIAAVSITDNERVLAHVGVGDDHHLQGQPFQTQLSRVAFQTGDMQIAMTSEQIQCNHEKCPLHAGILVPLVQAGDVVGLIKLYFQRAQQLRAVEITLAQGLGKLISNQLDLMAAEQLKELVRETRLQNLQAQINPHFLFNTLHMISTLIRVDPTLARHIVVQLGNFMRQNLQVSVNLLVDLREELDHLMAYLEIVKVRFSDQLSIECSVEEGIGEALIPPSTLQPLVENSIKHGLPEVTAGGTIHIDLAKVADDVEISVWDNGRGLPIALIERLGKQPVREQGGSGLGVYNVNQRLVSLLGAPSALRFENMPTGGCKVSFRIPLAQVKVEGLA